MFPRLRQRPPGTMLAPMNRDVPQIVLASTSPRRRMLLEQAGLKPRVLAPHAEEKPFPGESPDAFARRAAGDKAREVAGRLTEAAVAVIGGDTVVVLQGRILGKPRDRRDAARMLQALSGRSHEVLTGYCVLNPQIPNRQVEGVVRTAVRFKPLTPEQIQGYIDTGEPMDKAGAYGIQGRGSDLVADIRGSYTNVVGLPVEEVLQALAAVTA